MKPRIVYPKRNRKLMERLNTPWLCIPVTIGFIALATHAYPNDCEYGCYSDTDQAALSKLMDEVLDDKPMDAHAAMVYLYE